MAVSEVKSEDREVREDRRDKEEDLGVGAVRGCPK